jgi:hypothetical protein
LVQHPGRQFKVIEGRRTLFTTAYKTVRNWLTKNGLSIDIKKCELIHFTRWKKD